MPSAEGPEQSTEDAVGGGGIFWKWRGWWAPLQGYLLHNPARGAGEVLGAHPTARSGQWGPRFRASYALLTLPKARHMLAPHLHAYEDPSKCSLWR